MPSARRPRTRAQGRLAAGAGAAVAVTIAVALAAANVQVNNHRDDTYDTDYMRLFFESLPPGAAIIDEDYSLNNMVEYQKVATGMASVHTSQPPRHESIDRLHKAGARVFAFSGARGVLAHQYVMRPVELFGLTLNERLRPLERGRIVIVVGAGGPWPDLPALGIKTGTAPRSRAIVIAVKGSGVVTRTPDGFDGHVAVSAGQQLGPDRHRRSREHRRLDRGRQGGDPG